MGVVVFTKVLGLFYSLDLCKNYYILPFIFRGSVPLQGRSGERFGYFFGDLSQSEKLSENKPPLKNHQVKKTMPIIAKLSLPFC